MLVHPIGDYERDFYMMRKRRTSINFTLCRLVEQIQGDPEHEETKIVVIKEVSSLEFIPQSKCSAIEITPYKKEGEANGDDLPP